MVSLVNKMIYTLDYLKQRNGQPLNFKLNFKKEIEDMIMVEDIGQCFVSGSYSFLYSTHIRFELDIKVDLTLIAADTLNPINFPLEFKLIDEVSYSSETEYKIKDDKVDLYEMVWGWLAAEMPYGIFEK